MNKDVECPYCEEWNGICHDDGFGYEEDVAHEMECEHCEKSFVFYTSIIRHYEARKADCLNGSEHNFRDWQRVSFSGPKRLWIRRCRDCGTGEQEWRDEP